jgi:hypothetical protein
LCAVEVDPGAGGAKSNLDCAPSPSIGRTRHQLTYPEVQTMSENTSGSSDGKKRCFVVMGFHVKTDYATGRKLDLDKSYRLLIKPVVEERGVICVRADEIPTAGTIDQVMYQELFTADVVIADLSTANPNALYELGIRHALRPHTTIVISENKLSYPFDLTHVMISSYTHLGDAIDYDEIVRFRKLLGDNLDAVLNKEKTDSPVYTYLSDLTPPSLRAKVESAQAKVQEAVEKAVKVVGQAAADQKNSAQVSANALTLSAIVEQGEKAIKASNFTAAREMFAMALELSQKNSGENQATKHEDPYLLQRLALSTYKTQKPDEISALNDAMEILVSRLNLEDSNDPETIGLAGAIQKRLFDKGQGLEHLERAISCYARGYYLRNDRYNGINLAYLLNVRTSSQLDLKDTEKIADLVFANRLRGEVLKLCAQELAVIEASEQRSASAEPSQLRDAQKVYQWDQKFWCLATKAEAHLGLGEMTEYEKARADAQALGPASWMTETCENQLGKLRALLVQHGHLLDPPWSAG